ncbi:hypothetical protein [Photobacterium phosphoreum]|uniref:hypothetical protein n=1 Tax=Photobacterium phosphoreum TaxID=659 RepID=UPI0005D435FD|nr:hypothetical protein [Photobacterium phosphoreum]KJF84530.1 hypothetical protein UB41_19805 [Photobacterium phosphoreum]PQJ90302.1 hypothetical protein BTO21_00675 [Photobacterium phosphoreum]PSV71990.1 hypothetical protein CTM77_06360 [Photobacterium phosphoreum]
MGSVNSQTTSPQSTSQVATDITLDKLLASVGQTEGLTYFRFLLENVGFSTTGRWGSLRERIKTDIESKDANKARCTVGALADTIDRFLSSANHRYEIVELDSATATLLRTQIAAMGTQARTNSQVVNLYPSKFDLEDGVTYETGVKLCKVSDINGGYALIYSSVRIKQNSYKLAHSQAFHTVFVPHTSDRVEYRLSCEIRKSDTLDELKQLKIAFVNDVNVRGGKVDGTPVNFFEAIKSLYEDQNAGRISWGRVATFEEKPHQTSSACNDPGHCCRPELAKHDVSANGNTYHPFQITLRYLYPNHDDFEMELSFDPTRTHWDAKKCESIVIKEPKDSLMLSNIINTLLLRS